MTNIEIAEKLREKREYYTAEIVCNADREPLYRYSKATAEYLRHVVPCAYDGGKLYPCGRKPQWTAENGAAVTPEFSYTYSANLGLIKEKVPEAFDILREEFSRVAPINTPHTIGGAGYTHSFINYRRILKDGLKGYRERVNRLPECDFRAAMSVLLDGIEEYRQNCIAKLKEDGAPKELISALEYVPENSPRNIYEALVAWNFVYYVDGCDNIGGLDRALLPYWNGEDVTEIIREMFRHVDINDGWSCPLGPEYNGLTVQCIDAIHNGRRPNIQLLVTDKMPEEVWQAAYRSIGTSCGQPAFYNWDSYRDEIHKRIPFVSDEDLMYIAFGGCTETMIEGLSNVGSDDAGVNTALIFSDWMRGKLSECGTFDEFTEGYLVESEKVIDEVCAILEEHRRTRALYRPQPIRTLFIDDCIDRMQDFNAGGARYNWSVINVAGLINVIDSLVAVKKLVYDEKKYTAEEFIRLLDARDPVFLADCARQPKHGNDVDEVNDIANMVSGRIYARFETHTVTPASEYVGHYFPVSNQFTTYEYAGSMVKATPDGRADFEPLCDSCGAIHGRDTEGPTALLSSVASLRLDLVLGTPITNIRISKPNLPVLLKPLVEGFFADGGVQLQVTCASKEELLDAVAHPEKHETLVVRIGGFSEYFNRLSPGLKETVIARCEY